MIQTINIAVTIDDNYYIPLKIMLGSLFINNKHIKFNVYLCYSSLKAENRRDLNEYIISENCCLYEIKIADDLFQNIYSVPHVTKETFYRLMLPHILPESVEKVLYLDPDIIINASLSKLWSIPFNGRSIIAANVSSDNAQWNEQKKNIGIPLKAEYFNAGVIIMNLNLMRNNEHFNINYILDYMNRHYKRLREGDQAYLNKFLWNKAIVLPCNQYNFDTRLLHKSTNGYLFQLKKLFRKLLDIHYARKQAVIIHYRGSKKPWEKEYDGCFGKIFWSYAQICLGLKYPLNYRILNRLNILKSILSGMRVDKHHD